MRKAPETLFRSGDTLVLDLGATIRFKQTRLYELGLGVVFLAGGGLFGVALQGWPPRAPGSFSEWSCAVVVLCAVSLLVVGLIGRVMPPWELDPELRCLRRGSRRISFDELRDVRLIETRMGTGTTVALRLESTRGAIWLVTGQNERWRAALLQVRDRVMARLGEISSSGSPAISDGSPHRFAAVYALVFGALWTGLAWIAPDTVVVPAVGHASHGLRLWLLGPWIMALGVGELVGLKPLQILIGPRNRRRLIFRVLWFGSYFIAATVPL